MGWGLWTGKGQGELNRAHVRLMGPATRAFDLNSLKRDLLSGPTPAPAAPKPCLEDTVRNLWQRSQEIVSLYFSKLQYFLSLTCTSMPSVTS